MSHDSSVLNSLFGSVRRAPLLGMCLTFAVGIFVDHYVDWMTPYWSSLGFIATLGFGLIKSQEAPVISLVCLGLLFVSTGGISHEWQRHAYQTHPLSQFPPDESVMARVRVQLLEDIHIHRGNREAFTPAWMATDRTTFPATCLQWNHESLEPAGVLVTIRGVYTEARVGDLIEISGRFLRPSAPSNPGQFDSRDWMQREGYLGTVFVDEPDQVNLLPERRFLWCEPIVRCRTAFRNIFENSLEDRVSAGIATALVLGDRADLPDELRRDLIRSGTFHLLAISGLHIGLLSVMLSRLMKLFGVSTRGRAISLILFFTFYLLLTGMRPSVVRAVLFLMIYLAGQLLSRSTTFASTLGATGLILLVMNPLMLFESGTQLSFLSVSAIIVSAPAIRRLTKHESVVEKATQGLPMNPWKRVKRSIFDWGVQGTAVGIVVSLATYPVIASQFHLWPAYGVPLTLLLLPPVCLTLILGNLLLFSAFLLPDLSPVIGSLLEIVLRLIQQAVALFEKLPGESIALGDFPGWWFVGFLSLIISVLLLPRFRAWLFLSFVLWVGLHLGINRFSRHPDELRMTTYSVGHGLAILLEFPSGERVLYDCGSQDGGKRAASAVLGDLRLRGIDTINRLYLSHADLDHYSAFPRLAEDIEIEEIVTTQALLDSREPNLVTLRNMILETAIPMRTVVRDDVENFSSGVALKVLHPFEREYSSDNASSLVMSIEYAGRRILLSSDIEAEGMLALLESSSTPYDVVLSPHHGSLGANTEDFANWCRPLHVIVSSGQRIEPARLRSVYPFCKEFHFTQFHGAVIFRVTPEGVMNWREHRDYSSPSTLSSSILGRGSTSELMPR